MKSIDRISPILVGSESVCFQKNDKLDPFTPAKVEHLAVIDSRALERECFVCSVELSHPGIKVAGYGTPQEWLAAKDIEPALGALLINLGSRDVSTQGFLKEIVAQAYPVPVIVISESEDLAQMVLALDMGVCGYIPGSVGFDVIVEATHLACSGGVFLPATTLLALRSQIAAPAEPTHVSDNDLTSRQSAVASALRRGKANKIIAYELNMSESTVKVHIRNIMKKLNASNRTEAAFKLNSLPAHQCERLE